jgi:hypothetical protein
MIIGMTYAETPEGNGRRAMLTLMDTGPRWFVLFRGGITVGIESWIAESAPKAMAAAVAWIEHGRLPPDVGVSP